MSRKARVNIMRIAAALILGLLAVFQGQWLLLLPAALLGYQAYRDLACVLCEAGFCDGWPEKEEKEI